jgi:hypothetical protein
MINFLLIFCRLHFTQISHLHNGCIFVSEYLHSTYINLDGAWEKKGLNLDFLRMLWADSLVTPSPQKEPALTLNDQTLKDASQQPLPTTQQITFKPPPPTPSEFLDSPSFFAGFDPYFAYESFTVYRRLVPSTSLFEYKTRGQFPLIPLEDLVSVYLDFAYRGVWDPHFLEGAALHPPPHPFPSSSSTNVSNISSSSVLKLKHSINPSVSVSSSLSLSYRLSSLIAAHSNPVLYYYAIKMPYPLATRDYVYSLSVRQEECGSYILESVGRKTVVKPETVEYIHALFSKIFIKYIFVHAAGPNPDHKVLPADCGEEDGGWERERDCHAVF